MSLPQKKIVMALLYKHSRSTFLVILLLFTNHWIDAAYFPQGPPTKAVISGKVKDANTGEDLLYATVSIVGTSIGCTTNEYGFYSLTLTGDVLAQAEIKVLFTYLGYVSAEKSIAIKQSYDGEKLYSLFKKTMNNQGRKPGYPQRILVELCKEIEKRQCGCVLIGEDKNGIAHSGLLLVWDSTAAYYLVGGTDPELRESGAMPLTMWTAIKEASKHINVYDLPTKYQPA